jgi:hypothetical protein
LLTSQGRPSRNQEHWGDPGYGTKGSHTAALKAI